MFPQLHFTDDLPARWGSFPCLSPVWRCWLLRAAQSSSKLFACRHLKSITLTNPLSGELLPLAIYRGLMCPPKTKQDPRWNWFCTSGSANSLWEELQQRERWLPKLPHTHGYTMSNLYVKNERVLYSTAAAKLTACLGSCCVSGRGGWGEDKDQRVNAGALISLKWFIYFKWQVSIPLYL